MKKNLYKRTVCRWSNFFLLVGFCLLWASCSSTYDKLLNGTDYKAMYKAAHEYYDLGKYRRSAALFEKAVVFYRAMPQDDTLHFFWAKSLYNDKDIYSSEYYFRQFFTNFPRSPFAEEANYLYIASLHKQTFRYELDQTPSYRTLTAITDFSFTYPRSQYMEECHKIREDLTQRLDQKQFEAAKLYYTIGEYRSAITAFRTSLKDFPESRYKEEIRYLLVVSTYEYADRSYRHRQKDRYQAVVDEYYNFVSEFPESNYRKDVERMHAHVVEQIRLMQDTVIPVEQVITIEE